MNVALLGADELDIVINIGALKSGDWKNSPKRPLRRNHGDEGTHP